MWLVQRCNFRGNYQPGQKVSDAFDLDYMGSAEFEFGAIPKSIERLASKPNLTIKTVKYTNAKHHNFTYYILADETILPASQVVHPKPTDMERAQEALDAYISGKNGARRLKEHIAFGDKISESEFGSKSEYGFWWCVDEGFDHKTQGDKVNFCFTFDPEQARCFKLALAASWKYMDSIRKEKQRTA